MTFDKKICLIIPPSSFLLDERVFPFLGILKVASAFEQQGAHVDVLDLGGIENYDDVVCKYFELNKDDIEFVGITATTPQIPAAYNIGRLIKRLGKFKLVLGGSHITLTHTASKKIDSYRTRSNIKKLEKVFDIFVCGDGELTLETIRNVENGIIDVDNKKSSLFLSNKKFSELPNPARHLIDLSSYHYLIDGKPATSIISQLGCPYSCNFCSGRSSPYLRMIRSRSVDAILQEIEEIYSNYGYEGLMFYDDELNVNKSMKCLMRRICDFSEKTGIDLRLRGFIKAELFNEDQARAMYEAGFRWILVGFESGSSRILKNINKKATREDNSRCIDIAHKAGLKVKALMSIGHAGESFETIEKTKEWLLKFQPDDFDCAVITVYPGSPYFDKASLNLKTGIYEYSDPKTSDKLYQKEIDYTKVADYFKGAIGSYVSYVWTDYLTPKQLVKARDSLEFEVRYKLNIPYNPSSPAQKYEHLGGKIPDWILRSTK